MLYFLIFQLYTHLHSNAFTKHNKQRLLSAGYYFLICVSNTFLDSSFGLTFFPIYSFPFLGPVVVPGVPSLPIRPAGKGT